MGVGSVGRWVAQHSAGWEHLAAVDFDVALLQETRQPPAWAAQHWRSVVWVPRWADVRSPARAWGCAIVARHAVLHEWTPDESFPWLRERRGAAAIARMDDDPAWLASVHFVAAAIPPEVVDRAALGDVEITTRDGSVWETNVIPHELHRLFDGSTFLWGGDLNADPRMDDIRGFLGGNRRMFDGYLRAGAVDTRGRIHGEYQRTFFGARSGPYQLDHIFADPSTAARVTDWRVDAVTAQGDELLSDHAPILVVLDTLDPTAPRSSGDVGATRRPHPATTREPAAMAHPSPTEERTASAEPGTPLCRGWTASDIVVFARSANEIQAGFLAYVASNPGCTLDEAYGHLGLTYNQMRGQLAGLSRKSNAIGIRDPVDGKPSWPVHIRADGPRYRYEMPPEVAAIVLQTLGAE
jgi:hypothetical protein